jgi:DNA-binding CsgD family transcriptional regulator
MKLCVVTNNNYFFAGMEHIFSEVQCCLCRISSYDVYACTPNSNVIILLDGVNHKVSIKEYSYLKKIGLPVFFILNTNCNVNSTLIGINIINAREAITILKDRMISLFNGGGQLDYKPINLTKKESFILRLYIDGLSLTQISEKPAIRKKTLITHTRNILNKTGVKHHNHLNILKNILGIHLAH